MSTRRTIVITDRYHNTLTLTSDGTDITVETSFVDDAKIEIDEVDRDRLRDFLNG